MKKIEAMITKTALDDVVKALAQEGIDGLTASEVVGYGRRGPTHCYRGVAYHAPYVPKVKLELTTDDTDAVMVATLIRSVATRRDADGAKVWITFVEELPKLRSVEPQKVAV